MLIAFLRAEIRGCDVDESVKQSITEEKLEKLYELADSHDVSHIVADVLFKQKLMPQVGVAEKYQSCMMVAVFRYQQLLHEYNSICGLFEEHKISYMPLKGSVIRDFYPEAWLRTSCDIDILVKKEDLESAAELLISSLNYKNASQGPHDWGFFAENGVHLELHFGLIEQDVEETAVRFNSNWNADCLLEVWSSAHLTDGFNYRFEMSDELFYLYHIAHMAKHFETGGCGVRSFVDLWLINNIAQLSITDRKTVLEKSGLTEFEKAVRKLSDIWFSGCEPDSLSQRISDYILKSGVYGSLENRVAMQQNKKGSRFTYALNRIFLSYDSLKFYYPILHKHRWMTPFMELRRWFKLLFFGRFRQSVNELKLNSSLTDEQIESTAMLIKKLGL